MLALELCAADSSQESDSSQNASAGMTFIFDEVDAGVGGKAAVELGRRLAKLARRNQVIVESLRKSRIPASTRKISTGSDILFFFSSVSLRTKISFFFMLIFSSPAILQCYMLFSGKFLHPQG